jgi:hypothetical protein
MPLMDAASIVVPPGASSTAVRSKAALKDPALRLPEIPTILDMIDPAFLITGRSFDITPSGA